MQWSFSRLGELFFEVGDIFVVQQIAHGKTSFTMHHPRQTDALLFFANTTGICYQRGETPFFIPCGSLVYMPHDSMYMWENTPVGVGDMQENILFEFTLKKAETSRSRDEKQALSCVGLHGERISFGEKVSIISQGHAGLYEVLFRSLLAAFLAEPFSPLAVYGAVYDLFHAIAADLQSKEGSASDERLLRPALDMIAKEGGDTYRVEQLAELCHISGSYFERLFRRHTGMSVGEYRSWARLNRVKLCLQDESRSLAQISEELGYYDSGYLCRHFKKKTGMTPKEYRRLFLQKTAQLKKM